MNGILEEVNEWFQTKGNKEVMLHSVPLKGHDPE